MPERVIQHMELVLYALAAISGGLGGCVVASHGVLRGVPPRVSYVLAYGVIGMTFGLLTAVYGAMFGINTTLADSLMGASILVGAAGSIALASTNISARWMLKRLGIEVEVTVRRQGEERRTVE